MPINNLLKNPLIRICATILIVYLALFSNKENPNSLGNRFSKERLQKNFTEMKEKGQFIKKNIDTAKRIEKEKKTTQNSEGIKSDLSVKCGDKVITNYAIYTNNIKLNQIDNLEFVIGSKQNWLIEKNLIGMKNNEVKNINMLDSLTTNERKMISSSNINLQNNTEYKITVLQVIHGSDNKKISCN
jgi:hypothetical protein